jgi:hypothetical protein
VGRADRKRAAERLVAADAYYVSRRRQLESMAFRDGWVIAVQEADIPKITEAFRSGASFRVQPSPNATACPDCTPPWPAPGTRAITIATHSRNVDVSLVVGDTSDIYSLSGSGVPFLRNVRVLALREADGQSLVTLAVPQEANLDLLLTNEVAIERQ